MEPFDPEKTTTLRKPWTVRTSRLWLTFWIVYLTAAVIFLVSAMIASPVNPLNIVTGILLLAVGVLCGLEVARRLGRAKAAYRANQKRH